MALMETGTLKDPGTGRALYSFAHPLFWAPFSLIGDGR
jgi:CHAT domain-containing protein